MRSISSTLRKTKLPVFLSTLVIHQRQRIAYPKIIDSDYIDVSDATYL